MLQTCSELVLVQFRFVNICFDKNTLILMIDKRSPSRINMQNAEKKILAFKS